MRVCILSDSLSGLTLAKALTNQSIYVDILASKKKIIFNKSSTLGISKKNIDFINTNVIDINYLLWNIKKIEIFSDNLKDEKLINFENENNKIFSIIKNYDLYKILYDNLCRDKYFKKITKNNHKLPIIDNYDLIINNDFYHDVTRKYFSKKIVKEYNSKAYTTIIQHEKISNNIATQIFTKKGPLAFLPISETETSIVYSINNFFDKENIKELIQSYNFKYKINKINKINNFQLKSLNLRSYYHKNILAFGDLLHKVHPLAGQGFNMTIRDIKVLTILIKKKIELGLPLDSLINKDFENSQKHKNFIFSNGIDFIYEFFNIERKTRSKILSKFIKFLTKNEQTNKFFKKIADKGIVF